MFTQHSLFSGAVDLQENLLLHLQIKVLQLCIKEIVGIKNILLIFSLVCIYLTKLIFLISSPWNIIPARDGFTSLHTHTHPHLCFFPHLHILVRLAPATDTSSLLSHQLRELFWYQTYKFGEQFGDIVREKGKKNRVYSTSFLEIEQFRFPIIKRA